MKWLGDRNLAARITLAFGLVALLAGVVAFHAVRGMAALDAMVDTVGLHELSEADGQLLHLSRAVQSLVLE
jgi:hypothetical protein